MMVYRAELTDEEATHLSHMLELGGCMVYFEDTGVGEHARQTGVLSFKYKMGYVTVNVKMKEAV